MTTTKPKAEKKDIGGWTVCAECGHKYMGSCINCEMKRLEEPMTTPKPNGWEEEFDRNFCRVSGTGTMYWKNESETDLQKKQEIIFEIKSFIHQAILSAEAKERERIFGILKSTPYSTSTDNSISGFIERVIEKALSLPDQEQLEIKGKK